MVENETADSIAKAILKKGEIDVKKYLCEEWNSEEKSRIVLRETIRDYGERRAKVKG